jgi:hypothetical protein
MRPNVCKGEDRKAQTKGATAAYGVDTLAGVRLFVNCMQVHFMKGTLMAGIIKATTYRDLGQCVNA